MRTRNLSLSFKSTSVHAKIVRIFTSGNFGDVNLYWYLSALRDGKKTRIGDSSAEKSVSNLSPVQAKTIKKKIKWPNQQQQRVSYTDSTPSCSSRDVLH